MIKEEKSNYNINLSDKEISKLSKNNFKNFIDKKINEFAFNYLKERARSHSKSQNILKEIEAINLSTRKLYLNEVVLSKTDCQLLFMLRSKMLYVKANFMAMISPVEPVK